jgi:hypothetical protein
MRVVSNESVYECEDPVEKLVFEKDNSGRTISSNFNYPKLPDNIDFEVFRKDPKYKARDSWRQVVPWYNRMVLTDRVKSEQSIRWKERFICISWPRDPNGGLLKNIPPGKCTPNGGSIHHAKRGFLVP